uniref:Uncharacterized protein n=1 Tax=Setaria italica TaxID=4555 RepID=K3ZYN0_SETIT
MFALITTSTGCGKLPVRCCIDAGWPPGGVTSSCPGLRVSMEKKVNLYSIQKANFPRYEWRLSKESGSDPMIYQRSSNIYC